MPAKERKKEHYLGLIGAVKLTVRGVRKLVKNIYLVYQTTGWVGDGGRGSVVPN